MTDIVERLRKHLRFYDEEIALVIEEAADEIERLRAALMEISRCGVTPPRTPAQLKKLAIRALKEKP